MRPNRPASPCRSGRDSDPCARETDVDEVGRHHARPALPAKFEGAEGGPVRFEQFVDRIVVPARVAELEREAPFLRQQRQKRLQARCIAAEARRQLKQDGTAFFLQREEAREEELERFGAVTKPLVMRETTPSLHGEEKVVGRALEPATQHFLLR